MIPKRLITEQRANIHWQENKYIEQDMVINRALIDLYNNESIRDNLVFRGGTALNKLFLSAPFRYSEDIDFVLIEAKGVGFLMDAIKASLSWLGKAHTTRDRRGFKVVYAFENVDGTKSKLKIETNTTEHFRFFHHKKVPFSFSSKWFSGDTTIITYELEELMGTKLRALYQRRKGRDLFDIWHVFHQGLVDTKKVVDVFHAYNKYNGIKITRKDFVDNLFKKRDNKDFRQDIRLLLPVDATYHFDDAFSFVIEKIVPCI